MVIKFSTMAGIETGIYKEGTERVKKCFQDRSGDY